MVSINLYQPGIVNTTISFPENWNELTAEELMCICKRQLQQGFKTVFEQMAAVFTDIFILRCAPFKKQLPKNFHLLLDPEDASLNGLPLVNFLYNENRLTNQLFPLIVLPGFGYNKMYGPDTDFNNLTCGEFEDAEIFFNDFIDKPRSEPLAHLAAILWRPKNTPYLRFSRRKNKWEVYNHERRLQAFLRFPQSTLYAFFVWYAGCRSMMPLYFPTVYKKDPRAKNGEPDLLAFTKCIHGAAGPKNGSREDIRRTLIKEFFMELELEAQHAEKMLEETRNAND